MVVGKSKNHIKRTRKKIDFEVLNPTIFQFDCFSQLFTIFNQHRFVSNSCLFFTDTCRKKFPTWSWRKYVTVLVQILQLIFSKTEEFFLALGENMLPYQCEYCSLFSQRLRNSSSQVTQICPSPPYSLALFVWICLYLVVLVFFYSLMPYPCSHFYFDIKFGDRLYSKEKRRAWPLLF